MSGPFFLELDDVLAIHSHQIAHYGGSDGVRDLGLLRSALATPQASFAGEFLHPTLHEMASAYLFHLVQNHAFIDANERIRLAATIAFLGMNDLWLESDPRRACGVGAPCGARRDRQTGDRGVPEGALRALHFLIRSRPSLQRGSVSQRTTTTAPPFAA